MITATGMLYLYVETPLHVGAHSGLGHIDLPIQRERTTQYPMIQGSGIKGRLRVTAQESMKDSDLFHAIFGPHSQGGDASDHAGALITGDARILLFPVRSLSGVFAYTTSRDVLARFKRDFERTAPALPWNIPAATDDALVTMQSSVLTNTTLVLEEFSFDARPDLQVDHIATWLAEHALPDLNAGTYWPDKVRNALVILPEDDFRDFALYATEVVTRIRIDRESRTVESGALWTEEHLPSDTLFYVPIYATDARRTGKNGSRISGKDILRFARPTSNYMQLGADETIGRGIVRLRWQD
jgi:CRISPR-associated protein Cmr4